MQISDLHFSIHRDPGRISELPLLCEHWRDIGLDAVIVTGPRFDKPPLAFFNSFNSILYLIDHAFRRGFDRRQGAWEHRHEAGEPALHVPIGHTCSIQRNGSIMRACSNSANRRLASTWSGLIFAATTTRLTSTLLLVVAKHDVCTH